MENFTILRHFVLLYTKRFTSNFTLSKDITFYFVTLFLPYIFFKNHCDFQRLQIKTYPISHIHKFQRPLPRLPYYIQKLYSARKIHIIGHTQRVTNGPMHFFHAHSLSVFSDRNKYFPDILSISNNFIPPSIKHP